MTPEQKRWRYIDTVITEETHAAILSSSEPATIWGKRLGVSAMTIRRIRLGRRGARRKPMGGDRHSEHFRRGRA